MNNYSTDWSNIDLTSSWERHLNIIDPLSFADLLLEVNCNLPKINEQSVRRQFEEDLQRTIDSAREVFEANLRNVVKHAKTYRNRLGELA
jgi:DNA-directed RNA polymerase sigma subunit (sigma70/sigma32)